VLLLLLLVLDGKHMLREARCLEFLQVGKHFGARAVMPHDRNSFIPFSWRHDANTS